jgi:hypothetical protein
MSADLEMTTVMSISTDQETPKDVHNWPAALFLLILASITAEMLTGSTPVLVFFTNPVSFIGNILLYGLGALLIRETVYRRNLGWASVLWMGAAYGIFEEGLVINTWANPWAEPVCNLVNGVQTGLCDYSRVGGINLLWALELTIFHAIVSITIPILLGKLVFPERFGRPWLGRKAIGLCVIGELICLAAGLLLNFAAFRQQGQARPLLLPYLIEIGLMTACVAIALRLRPSPGSAATRPAPGVWALRFLGFGFISLMLLSPGLYKSANLPYPIGLIINLAILAGAVWQVRNWSRRTSWDERHILALASGALGFFLIVWDPILEIIGQAGGKPTRGTVLVALAYLIFLILVERQTAGRMSRKNIEAQSAGEV